MLVSTVYMYIGQLVLCVLVNGMYTYSACFITSPATYAEKQLFTCLFHENLMLYMTLLYTQVLTSLLLLMSLDPLRSKYTSLLVMRMKNLPLSTRALTWDHYQWSS